MAAGTAQFRIALGEAVRHRNPLVEDEALALPQALFGRYLLEISKDAALEVEHILEAERLDVSRRLFAANAAGAEHRHLAAFELRPVRFHPGREFAKACGRRIDRAFAGADRHLVGVARVDNDRLG